MVGLTINKLANHREVVPPVNGMRVYPNNRPFALHFPRTKASGLGSCDQWRTLNVLFGLMAYYNGTLFHLQHCDSNTKLRFVSAFSAD